MARLGGVEGGSSALASWGKMGRDCILVAVNTAEVAVPGPSSLAYSEGGGDVVEYVVECDCEDADSEGLLAER